MPVARRLLIIRMKKFETVCGGLRKLLVDKSCKAFHLLKFRVAWYHLLKVHTYTVTESDKLMTYGELWDFHRTLAEVVQ